MEGRWGSKEGAGPSEAQLPLWPRRSGFLISTAAGKRARGERTARASQAEATGVSRAAPSGAPGAFQPRRPCKARLLETRSEFFPSGFTTRTKTRRLRPTGIGPRGLRDRGRPCLGRRVLSVHSYGTNLRNPPDSTVRPWPALLGVEFMQAKSASGPEGGCSEPRAFSADRSGRRHWIGGDAKTTDGKTSDVLRTPCNCCRCVI